MGKKEEKNRQKWLLAALLGGLLVKLGFMAYKNKNRGAAEKTSNFIKAEKKEFKRFCAGQESLAKFACASGKLFKDFFIPHEGNNHKPKFLHVKSLSVICIALLVIKISVTGYLFFLYPNQAYMSEEIVRSVLELTNQDRLNNNLVSLTINPVLNAAALAKANDMVASNYFAHHSPDGKKPWDWIDRGQYAYLFVGENLAMNFTSARSAHNALMQSVSHKQNILNARYDEVGLAMVSGVIDGKQTNILVELFATKEKPKMVLAMQSDNTAGTTKPHSIISENKTEVLAAETVAASEEPAVKSSPKPKLEPEPEAVVEADTAVEPAGETAAAAQTESDKSSGPKVIKYGAGKQLAANDQPIMTIASPNKELTGSPNTRLSYYAAVDDQKLNLGTRAVSIAKYIYIAALFIMIIVLLVNIAVRMKIQHKPVIIQTVVVILFISGLISIKLHILEQIAGKIAIL